jgi:hypothetical protein
MSNRFRLSESILPISKEPLESCCQHGCLAGENSEAHKHADRHFLAQRELDTKYKDSWKKRKDNVSNKEKG